MKYCNVDIDKRFAYQATDKLIRFYDYYDDKYRSREIFSFHKPETLKRLIEDNNTLRNRMKDFPEFCSRGFRDCQVDAIIKLEKSFSENRPRALVQMATGAGKTYTAVTSTYRLLKHAKVNRILFLVDTRNLGIQAESEFNSYKPYDDNRLFNELYNVRRINSSFISNDTTVCISTIQRMYSILCGKEMDESAEDESFNEVQQIGKPREVKYNSNYPPEFFDMIIIDECHRSIYNDWQQVLDYFDAFLIGLTATPDKRALAFFNQNVVSEYTHEEAVVDGVNVGRSGTFIIETQISKAGGTILKGVTQKRDRLTREKLWESVDEDMLYAPSQLDKSVVNPSQIREIIKSFKDKVFVEMFPNRKHLPKTLVFAKTDSHAEDIVNIIREEFGEGNEFCKKVTYQSTDDLVSTLNAFRNDFYPRVAVTVDMIATGTDVKPIECLIFMRDVRSKNYFEQMLGRATRTLGYEDLKRVSPDVVEEKTGFVVVDAVGVFQSNKNTSMPQIERKKNISLKDLMLNVTMGSRDEDTLTSLGSRLLRLNDKMNTKEKEKFAEICESNEVQNVRDLGINLINAFKPDYVNIKTINKYNVENPTEEQYDTVSKELAEERCNTVI